MTSMGMKQIFHRISQALLVGSFLLAIFLPPVTSIFSEKRLIAETEKRQLAQIPRLSFTISSLMSFPSGFDEYYKDHFGFRNQLIYLNNYINVHGFNKSPLDKVLLGKNGWLYVNDPFLLDDHRGVHPLTRDQLVNWRQTLQSRKIWLEKKGIHYIFMIPPDKRTIYPEYLQDVDNQIQGDTRLQQLAAYLKNHSDVAVIDFRDDLKEMKKLRQVYYRCDTHWNAWGAYYGYRTIMQQMMKWYPEETILEPSAFTESTVDSYWGDLAIMLNLHSEYNERIPQLTLAAPCAVQHPYPAEGLSFRTGFPPFDMQCGRSNLKAVVFRDSFFTEMVPFFSEHFAQVVYIWNGFSYEGTTKLLETEKPDVIIDETAEQTMIRMEPTPDPKILWDNAEPVLLLDKSNQNNVDIITADGQPVVANADGMVLQNNGKDPTLLMSLEKNLYGVEMRITSPADTDLQIYYQTPLKSYYTEDQSIWKHLVKGDNPIRVMLPAERIVGSLRIDQGETGGDYYLHNLSVRDRDKDRTPLFELEKNFENYTDLSVVKDTEIVRTAEGVLLRSSGNDPGIQVALKQKNENVKADKKTGTLLMELDIVCPEKTYVQLYYQTIQKPFYTEAQSIYMPVNQGDNTIWFKLPGQDITGLLRLDYGHIPGEYRISRIDVRRTK